MANKEDFAQQFK